MGRNNKSDKRISKQMVIDLLSLVHNQTNLFFTNKAQGKESSLSGFMVFSFYSGRTINGEPLQLHFLYENQERNVFYTRRLCTRIKKR